MNTQQIDFPDADTSDKLGDLYEDFCTAQDLPHMESDKLLAMLGQDLTPLHAQITWLQAFEKKWREVEIFEDNVLILSRYICAIMREALTPRELAKVNRINAEQGMEHGCASHDVIDANIVAYGAFCSVFFREMDSDSEEDCKLVNLAWDRAMRCGYGVEQGPSA